eukprot:5805422-Amphidinium_carterae.1
MNANKHAWRRVRNPRSNTLSSNVLDQPGIAFFLQCGCIHCSLAALCHGYPGHYKLSLAEYLHVAVRRKQPFKVALEEHPNKCDH